MARSTENVAATQAWLGTSGFVLVEQYGGAQAPFGDVIWIYNRVDGIGVRIALMAREIELPDIPRARNPYEVVQLPDGVDWREHLPATVDWLTGAHAVADLLDSAQAAAVSALHAAFPSPPPQEAAASREKTIRDYYRQQHAKRHPSNGKS
jgi:hypothetical protein